MLAGLEVDAVQDEIQVALVRFDLWNVDFAQSVFDRERVKLEGVRQDLLSFIRCRRRQVYPEHYPGRCVEPASFYAICQSSLTMLADEDGHHQSAPCGMRCAPCRVQGTLHKVECTRGTTGGRRTSPECALRTTHCASGTGLQSPTRTARAACAAARRATGTRYGEQL